MIDIYNQEIQIIRDKILIDFSSKNALKVKLIEIFLKSTYVFTKIIIINIFLIILTHFTSN